MKNFILDTFMLKEIKSLTVACESRHLFYRLCFARRQKSSWRAGEAKAGKVSALQRFIRTSKDLKLSEMVNFCMVGTLKKARTVSGEKN